MGSFQSSFNEEFQATVFGLGESNQSQQASVRFSGNGVVITLSDSQQPSRTLSYERLRAGLGGFGGHQLVLEASGAAQAQVSLYIADPDAFESLLQNAPVELRAQVEDICRSRSRSKRWAVVLALGCLGAILVAAVGFYLSIDPLVGLAVDQIPVEFEKNLGQAALQQVIATQTMVKDASLQQGIDEIVQRLVAAAGQQPYTFHFTIVRSEEVNAFALPGGQVVIFSGLLEKSDTPEEVAGVLAHEMQHVLQRHSMRRLVRNLGVVAIAQLAFGDLGGFAALSQQMATELVLLKFDRGQESEADQLGLDLLIAAKIDPQGMPAFFERLALQEGKLQQAMSFALTHPGSGERAAELRKEIASRPPMVVEPFSFDWTALRRKAAVATGP